MADSVESRAGKRKKAAPREPAAQPPAPRRVAAVPPTVMQENAMDIWLREELRRLYAHVLEDPLPPDLVELLWAYETYEDLNNGQIKATGRKH